MSKDPTEDTVNALPAPIEESMGETFAAMADSHHRIQIPRKNVPFKRADVVRAFQDAFELIGGVPRLAVWAHTHETEFFKIYGKLLPTQAEKQLSGSAEIHILSNIGRSPLDGPPEGNGEVIEGEYKDG